MTQNGLDNSLKSILTQYRQSFTSKQFTKGSKKEDDLMRIFGLTQAIKSENKQYWSKELGMCWQLLVTELCRQTCDNFSGSIKDGTEELCDLVLGMDAINAMYRMGSGDSRTLKKVRHCGNSLKKLGYRPILLILRDDNLPAAITACTLGNWVIMAGDEAFQYLQKMTKFDLKAWLQAKKNHYPLTFT
jgi:hypothetical protein